MNDRIIYHEASDGTRLAVGSFPAKGNGQLRGPVVMLLHGIASHMGWYRGLAELLQSRGVSMYLPDRRGVARSQGPRGHASRWAVLADDVVHLAESLERRHPSQPMHLMGVSLGSAIAVACALRHPGLFRSLILLSPALATSVRVPLARKLATLGRALAAPTTLVDLPFGLEQLTSNLEWREALSTDQRRTSRVTARFLIEVMRLQRFIRRQIRHLGAPVLALFAEKDEIIDNERSIQLLNAACGATVRVEVFESASHLLAASVPRRQLGDRVMTWLQGDHGSVSDRFSLLHTILSHPGGECEPPRFGDDPDDQEWAWHGCRSGQP